MIEPTEQLVAKELNVATMKAIKFEIDTVCFYDKFGSSSAIEFISIKDDIVAAIDEYETMYNELAEAKKAFSELGTEFPELFRNREYNKLRGSVRMRLSGFESRINELAGVYETAVGFATNIIEELREIVLQEENQPWDIVDLEQKKELLEMTIIRLMGCTHLLRFCNDIKQKILTIFDEIKNLFIKSQNQCELFMKNMKELANNLSEKTKEIQPVINRLRARKTLVTKGKDIYGRFQLNKWVDSWKNDITNWKMHAYRGIAAENIFLVSKILLSFYLFSLKIRSIITVL